MLKTFTRDGNTAMDVYNSVKAEYNNIRQLNVARQEDGIYNVQLEIEDTTTKGTYVAGKYWGHKKGARYDRAFD